tara:strand:- start:114 stop:509 length:396 start_codon:yes stop_codon:yes gene_type:complete
MKKLFNLIFLFITVISINLYNPGLKTLAFENVEWVLLKENSDGKEWLDIGSLKKYNNNEISVLTKYSQNPTKDKVKGNTSLYVMRINCSNRKFKDISINGITNFKAKWKNSNNDELIDIVIDRSCSESTFK